MKLDQKKSRIWTKMVHHTHSGHHYAKKHSRTQQFLRRLTSCQSSLGIIQLSGFIILLKQHLKRIIQSGTRFVLYFLKIIALRKFHRLFTPTCVSHFIFQTIEETDISTNKMHAIRCIGSKWFPAFFNSICFEIKEFFEEGNENLSEFLRDHCSFATTNLKIPKVALYTFVENKLPFFPKSSTKW